MAHWDKITSRGNIEDRRGMRNGLASFGITGVLLVMGATYLMGGNPLDVLTQVDIAQVLTPQTPEDVSQFAGVDSYEEFVASVLGSTNDYWNEALPAVDATYTEPKLVLFRGSTNSGCSGATSAVGPHYCPADATIYLDETFFDELTNLLGAKGGDVAEAYVIAHEVGHHVQNISGTIDGATLDNADSIAIELQADCYAGLWAHSLRDKGIFEINEIAEAMDAAQSVGDDRIQQKTEGEVHPESWTHGSAEDRLTAFSTGYETGDIKKCTLNR
jgi:uncharacterized protein